MLCDLSAKTDETILSFVKKHRNLGREQETDFELVPSFLSVDINEPNLLPAAPLWRQTCSPCRFATDLLLHVEWLLWWVSWLPDSAGVIKKEIAPHQIPAGASTCMENTWTNQRRHDWIDENSRHTVTPWWGWNQPVELYLYHSCCGTVMTSLHISCVVLSWEWTSVASLDKTWCFFKIIYAQCGMLYDKACFVSTGF